MSSGGLTFGASKAILATVCENGIGASDPRVITRTNEAIQACLDEGVWVNGCMTVDVMGSGTDGDELFLPKELENVYDAEVLDADAYGARDLTQSFYNIVNPFTYLDPQASYDAPLQDLYLQPDPNDASILRRKYKYVGLTPNAIVRVTGAKRYLPITSDGDYLIVQNVLALKDMIQAIWKRENNDKDGADSAHESCIKRLTAEVKKHQLDPRNVMRRKAEYYKDLQTFAENTFGWMRANLATEMNSLLMMGKSDLSWLLNMAEKRLMQRALSKDTIVEYIAEAVGGEVAFPREVQSVLAVDLCGRPIPVRSVFHEYLENGPGYATLDSSQSPAQWTSGGCHPMLVDQGDEEFQGGRRRTYKLIAPTDVTDPPHTITAVCKLRWLQKGPEDLLIIKNFEALRCMIQAIQQEEKEQWQEAAAAEQKAYQVIEAENREYLSGIRHTIHVQVAGFAMTTGGPL